MWRHGHASSGEKLKFAALGETRDAPAVFDYVWLPSPADEPSTPRRLAALQHTTSGAVGEDPTVAQFERTAVYLGYLFGDGPEGHACPGGARSTAWG